MYFWALAGTFVIMAALLGCASVPEPERPPAQIEKTVLKGYQLKLTNACTLTVSKGEKVLVTKSLEHRGLCFFGKNKRGVQTYVHLPNTDTGVLVLVHSSQKNKDKCESLTLGVMVDRGVLHVQKAPFLEGAECRPPNASFRHEEFSSAWFAIKAGRSQAEPLAFPQGR